MNTSLESFLETCEPEQAELIHQLLDLGQEHLFADWDSAGTCEKEKETFLKQLARVDTHYPGGLKNYIANAQTLLARAKEGANPFEGYIPHQPNTVNLTNLDEEYDRLEALGAAAFDRLGIVLVAGGLGERLGFSGIKLSIPVESIEKTSYFALYASTILAMQSRTDSSRPIPFIIMTSEDTHAQTVTELEEHAYFGLQPSQVTLLKQELVPALADNDARIALQEKYSIQLKPHGHGDVHMLLHSSGVAKELQEAGIGYLMFIQDTNGQVFNALPAALGASIDHDFDFNSLGVNRVPGEAVGAISRLVNDDEEITVNVEYNQLDPLLRSTISPEGDVPGENGYSMFPGNVNALVIKMASYIQVLEKTQGIIAEFVNPKYADKSRTEFKKPTRLETMMQDLPKLYDSGERVGVTVFNREWCFSPNKNNLKDAAAKVAGGSPPESAASAESDLYLAGRMKLAAAGVEVNSVTEQTLFGIPYVDGPRIFLHPSFALTVAEAKAEIAGGVISDHATLILDGQHIRLDHIELSDHAALVVHAGKGAKVSISGNLSGPTGYKLTPLSEEELASAKTSEVVAMRGFRYQDEGAHVFSFPEPGDYEINLSDL